MNHNRKMKFEARKIKIMEIVFFFAFQFEMFNLTSNWRGVYFEEKTFNKTTKMPQTKRNESCEKQ